MKKIASVVLAFILVCTTIFNVYASKSTQPDYIFLPRKYIEEEKQDLINPVIEIKEEDLELEENKEDEFKYYIPLEKAVLNSDGKVSTHRKDMIVVHYKGVKYNFMPENKIMVSKNKTERLEHPILFKEEVAYVHYDDISFLFENPRDLYHNLKREIITSIYETIDIYGIVGLTVAFTDTDSDYSWQQGFGYSDFESKTPITKDTIFSLGSISKSFTSLMILKLVEEGKIDLDKSVKDYMLDFSVKEHPYYGGRSSKITTRMLLNHFSGINDNYFPEFLTYEKPSSEYMNNLISGLKNEYMSSETEKYFKYSNVGYGVLGVLIGTLSDKESDNYYENFLNYSKEEFFEKLDMTNSSFDKQSISSKELAKPYVSILDEEKENIFVNNLSAAAVHSNAVDMTKFMDFMIRKGKVEEEIFIEEATFEKMIEESKFVDPLNTDTNYSLGIELTNKDNEEFIGHSGKIDYFNCEYKISLNDKIGVFVASNSSSSEKIISECVDNILEQGAYIKKAMQISENTETKELENQAEIETYPEIEIDEKQISKKEFLTKKEIEDKLGFYLGIGNIVLKGENTLVFKDLALEFPQQLDGGFGEEDFLTLYFDKINDVEGLFVKENENMKLFSQKLEIEKADSRFIDWSSYYLPINLSDDERPIIKMINLKFDSGYPVLEIFPSGTAEVTKLYLRRIDKNRYFVMGLGEGLGSVITKVEEKGKRYISYNGMVFEEI